ncbi:MAG: hypothetical protein IT162_21970 [Bryobacterales bacterium]|nr:hypothetical protein [Bryobacterales bacterium]
MPRNFVGITVMPEYIQNEGIEAVLDHLINRAGVTAVATSPYVMEPADEKTGSREPPIDAGAGSVRLLDRPLWGKRELFVRTGPAFQPDTRLYAGLRYQPAATNELTARHGVLIRQFIRAAQARKLKVYLQVQAAIPPGYRVQFGGPQGDDKPQLPDGRVPPTRLANNGSLASPHITAYHQALLKDLIGAYPDVDGLRVDWPEYPPYFLDDVFLDFGPHAEAAARRLGFDFEAMKRAAGALYQKLHGGLTDADLAPWSSREGGRHRLLRALSRNPALLDWLRFKATLVEELLGGFRRAMNEAGAPKMDLLPNAFPPPWTLASGIDFARCAKHVSGFSVKLYTMHWPVMLRFYADAILRAHPAGRLNEAMLLRALAAWLDMSDAPAFPSLREWRYPEPDEPHPAGDAAMGRKIVEAQYEAGPAVPVYTLAHGYGPLTDFARRLQVAWQSSRHGLWINRYGYLSNEKLDAVGRICRREA